MKKKKPDASTDASGRKAMGRVRKEASFPVPPTSSDLPDDYGVVLEDIKKRIRSERLRVTLAANSAMIMLYWDIGKLILERQESQGWGARVIDRLSHDLKQAFPETSGFSPRNLKYMRKFADAWPDRKIVQCTVAQIPWRSNLTLLERCKGSEARLWYARKTVENGWSRDILALQIDASLHDRQGKAVNNFQDALPPSDSDMAAQVFKDPYLFDFLGTADPRKEREVEQALVDHIQKFLMEMGAGFAFVGRQVLLEVGDNDFYADLLFYHLHLRCFIVVELKAVPFDPAFVGQLNLYLSAVDDLMCHPEDKPTIGLLLCKSRDRLVAEYALRGLQKPIGVAEWETRLVETLPVELEGSLPTIEEIEAELSGEEGEE